MNFITTTWLNLRSQPAVNRNNVLVVMPPDTVVQQISANGTSFMEVKTVLGKTVLEGFASAEFLVPTELKLPDATPVDPVKIPAVHLPLRVNRIIKRGSTEGRAYPLNEPGLVKKDLATLSTGTSRKAAVHKVIEWLDVEHSDRYEPTSRNTFCNIYAYDVAYCLGAFLPRVWWNDEAITRLLRNQEVQPLYDRTVRELNANSLTNWFEQYGPSFQWQRFTNLTSLQERVNKGTLGIIVGRRTNLNQSGHIVAVVPETAELPAQRNGDKVISPLQSQAGARNRQYFTSSNWWTNPAKFAKFGFWALDI